MPSRREGPLQPHKMMQGNRMQSKRKVLFGFIAVGGLLAFVPAAISFPVELDAIPGLTIFTLLNLLPLAILLFVILSQDRVATRQLDGLLWAGASFILTHFVFNLGILYELARKEPGFSTSVIAYLFLPVIASVLMLVAYLLGYLLKRNWVRLF